MSCQPASHNKVLPNQTRPNIYCWLATNENVNIYWRNHWSEKKIVNSDPSTSMTFFATTKPSTSLLNKENQTVSWICVHKQSHSHLSNLSLMFRLIIDFLQYSNHVKSQNYVDVSVQQEIKKCFSRFQNLSVLPTLKIKNMFRLRTRKHVTVCNVIIVN